MYNERWRTIDYYHYPRIEAARRTLTHSTRPLHRDEAAVIRHLCWTRRYINFHLKTATMSNIAFFNSRRRALEQLDALRQQQRDETEILQQQRQALRH